MKKILIKASTLALMCFVSISCKKKDDPAPLTKQDVVDVVYDQFVHRDSLGVNTVSFTVSGKRSESVSYSYTRNLQYIITSDYVSNFNSNNVYFYFYPNGLYSYNSKNSCRILLSGINITNVNVADINIYSNELVIFISEQLPSNTFHEFNNNMLPTVVSNPSSLSNLKFDSKSRILTGNFNIPKRYARYNYNYSTGNYDGIGSSLEVVNGSFSIYIPENKTIIERKEK